MPIAASVQGYCVPQVFAAHEPHDPQQLPPELAQLQSAKPTVATTAKTNFLSLLSNISARGI